MKTTFISSYATSQSMRHQMTRMQAELVRAEREVVTSRVADSGLHLGARTGHSVGLEREVERLKGIIDTNGVAKARLAATQGGLQTLSQITETYLSTLTAGSSGSVDPEIIATEAQTAIVSMRAALNQSLNGENIFAGINTDVMPIKDVLAPGSDARNAFEAAFQTNFGFAISDPQAATISADDISAFLTDTVEPMFMGASWSDWSNASSNTIVSRITANDMTSSSVSANVDGVRYLAMSAATVAFMAEAGLGDAARRAVYDHAAGTAGKAVPALAQTQAQTGIVEARIASASERLSLQVDILTSKNTDMVGIDPYEASSRISILLAQVETSYLLTSRMRQLSLVRHLP